MLYLVKIICYCTQSALVVDYRSVDAQPFRSKHQHLLVVKNTDQYSPKSVASGLLAGRAATIQFLVEFLEISRRKYVLEKKKNGNYSPEVLLDVFTLSYDGRQIVAADVLA